MSFYSNPATRAKAAREARERQMQEELERRERIRQNLSYSAKDARAEEVREIEQARNDYQREFQAYYSKMREAVMVQPDVDGFFDAGPALDCDPSIERDVHWSLFVKDTPEFYNSQENRDTLSQYLKVNNCDRYDRWVLSAAYKRLLSLGLLETAESIAQANRQALVQSQPEVLEEPKRTHFRIVDNDWDRGRDNCVDDSIEGTDPATGLPLTLTRWQLEQLDADNFRKFARISRADRTLAGYMSNYGTKYEH